MTQKDLQRMIDLRDRANGDVRREITLACTQANRITGEIKILGRWKAAQQIFGENHVVARIFADRRNNMFDGNFNNVDKEKYLNEELERQTFIDEFGKKESPKEKEEKEEKISISTPHSVNVNELIMVFGAKKN